MVSMAILQSYFLTSCPKSFKLLCDYLDICQHYPTGKHWIDNLITPTLLAHQLLRSEKEGDFLLQQLTLEVYFPTSLLLVTTTMPAI